MGRGTDLRRHSCRIAVENRRSRAIPERLGFRKEGTRRQAELVYGRYLDSVVYAMLGGFDAQAIKSDRPDLEAVADREIVRRIAAEKRTLVSNDILDFQLIHNQMLAAGEEHYGLIFTSDSTMPRNKASIPLWVRTLGELLREHPADDALRNRVHHLS